MTWRAVISGRAEYAIVRGDALASLLRYPRQMPDAVLGFHVARLTESDQVLLDVRFISGEEGSERANVVDGQALADVAATVGAMAALRDHYQHADALPIPTTVGHGTADPQRRPLAGQMQPLALPRAVFADVAGSSHLPMRGHEDPSAGGTGSLDAAALPTGTLRPSQGRGLHVVGAWGPSNQIHMRDFGYSETRSGTEPFAVPSGTWNEHDCAALLAGFRLALIGTHGRIVP